MIRGQMSLFDGSQQFHNDKPIRLIELFSGYSSQALALKYLGIPFEHYKTSEWAVKSIQAAKDLHFGNDSTDYSQGKSVDEIRAWLNGRISSDYNTPMTEQQISRLSENQVRTIYNNMQATHNLGSITNITAKDLAITDTDKYCYIMTYSYPCQDVSNAGKQAGMSKDSGTRSALLWEVERLLKEMEERPQILLMENVPQVHGEGNKQDFYAWIRELEELGYHNYWQDLNAKDYGIPQNRNRCFVISLIGDYYYSFPKPQKLNVRLKDFLDKQVDEKYYLFDKTIEIFIEHTKKQQAKGNGFKFETTDENGVAKLISTRSGSRCEDNYIQETVLLSNKGTTYEKTTECVATLMARDYKGFGNQAMNAVIETCVGNKQSGNKEDPKCEQVATLCGGKWEKLHDANRRVYSDKGLSPTITTMGGGQREPKIIEPVCLNSKVNGKQPSLTDRVYDTESISTCVTTSPFFMGSVAEPIAYDEQNGYLRQDGCVGTLTTDGSSPKHNNRVVEPKVMVVGNYSPSGHNASSVVDTKGIVSAVEKSPIIYDDYNSRVRTDQDGVGTLTTNCSSAAYGVKIVEPQVINPLAGKTGQSWFFEQNVYDSEGITRALKSSEGSGNIPKVLCEQHNYRFFEQAFETVQENDCQVGDTIDAFNKRVNKDGVSPAITTRPDGFKTAILPITQDYRIRKLTERECFRLMGVKGNDFEKVAKNQSASSLYHLAGDSICVSVLMAIFGKLFNIENYEEKIADLINTLKQGD